MRPKVAALWVAIVVALLATLYQTSPISSFKEWCSCTNKEVRRRCMWARNQCSDDCGRHGLFHENGAPATADAWENTTNPFSMNPAVRSSLYRFGARVACWPSTGGIWMKHALPIEMSFLDLSLRYDTYRPEDLDPVEEDAFCTKLRLIGAEFWQNPPNLTDCSPLEECVKPHVRGDLGMAWIYGEEKGLGGAHMVNLTDARIKNNLGPGMRGYFQAPDMLSRLVVSEYMGGVWCPDEQDLCTKLWCTQYPDHCNEARHLMNDDALWKSERKRGSFW